MIMIFRAVRGANSAKPSPPACVAAEPAMPGASHPPRRDLRGRDAVSTRNRAASNERNGRTVKSDDERAEQVSVAPTQAHSRGPGAAASRRRFGYFAAEGKVTRAAHGADPPPRGKNKP